MLELLLYFALGPLKWLSAQVGAGFVGAVCHEIYQRLRVARRADTGKLEART